MVPSKYTARALVNQALLRYNNIMQAVMIIAFGVICFVLVAVSSITPRRSVLSTFELERRRNEGNESAAEELKRELLLSDILSLKHILEAVLLVLMVMMAIGGFDLFIGFLVSVLVALCYGRIATLDIIHTGAQRFYEQYDSRLISFLDRQPRMSKLLRTVPGVAMTDHTPVASREELEHLIDGSGTLLSGDERKCLINGLHFNEKTIEQIMTPRSVIDTINKDELIGPLTLDALHKTGHSRFPVTNGDIDHIVGVLHIKELLQLDNKTSPTAEKVMEKKVYYINQDQQLQHALAAFIKTRHHLFVVVNGYRETAGIVTLEDVVEALLGRKIADEYDVHDDLRIVAERNAKDNNNPPHATNV